jgi:hypothetical protein
MGMAEGTEGGVTVGAYTVTGLRTYSIVFLIVATYCYLCLTNNKIDELGQLALMAVGFLFGVKAVSKK